jgi:hypothetical protein
MRSSFPLGFWVRRLPVFAALIGLLAASAADGAAKDAPPRLEKALLQQGPRLMDYLKKQKFQNVGVLKFQVRKDGKLTDHAGPINHTIARRLEVALVLANDEKSPIGIIENASAVAAKTMGANHLSPKGRTKLFEPKYPLAWGKAKVSADAFVTGVVTVLPRRDRLSVQLLIFSKGDNELKELLPAFETAIDVKTLEESSESYNLRGMFDDEELSHTRPADLIPKVQTAANKVKEEQTTHPVKAKNAPVDLVILYDGQQQKVETEGGQARVAEPGEGQNVEFIIRKKNAQDPETYGVVVKVNGHNTLFREKELAELCHKWLLTPDHAETRIRGFQDTDEQVRAFRVSALEESRANEIKYGDDVGTISMVVFRAETRETPKDLPGDEREAVDLAALTRGSLPKQKAVSLAALKDQLVDLGEATVKSRGLLEEGEATPGNVKRLKFTPNPTPVMSVTIFYYQRQSR